jgi:hypothetical protein
MTSLRAAGALKAVLARQPCCARPRVTQAPSLPRRVRRVGACGVRGRGRGRGESGGGGGARSGFSIVSASLRSQAALSRPARAERGWGSREGLNEGDSDDSQALSRGARSGGAVAPYLPALRARSAALGDQLERSLISIPLNVAEGAYSRGENRPRRRRPSRPFRTKSAAWGCGGCAQPPLEPRRPPARASTAKPRASECSAPDRADGNKPPRRPRRLFRRVRLRPATGHDNVSPRVDI